MFVGSMGVEELGRLTLPLQGRAGQSSMREKKKGELSMLVLVDQGKEAQRHHSGAQKLSRSLGA